ncbi:MAG: hypothetical protein ACTH5C_08600 [Pseudoalteromonas prydzensis]
MVIIFFNRGKGSGHGPADYLMGKDRNRKGAQVIRGDLNACSGTVILATH